MPPGKCQHTHKAALEAPALPREADEDKCFGWRLSGPPAAGPAGMEVAAPSAQEHLPELQRAAVSSGERFSLLSSSLLHPGPGMEPCSPAASRYLPSFRTCAEQMQTPGCRVGEMEGRDGRSSE